MKSALMTNALVLVALTAVVLTIVTSFVFNEYSLLIGISHSSIIATCDVLENSEMKETLSLLK